MRSERTADGGKGNLTVRLLAILASLLSAPVAALPAAAAVPDLGSSAPRHVQVIVQSTDSRGAAALVERLGGRVVRPLPIVDGFAARLPASRVAALERSPLVRTVTPDGRVVLAGETGGEDAGTANPLAAIADQIGADELWARGLTGAGVDVALIDSGVVPVAGMGNVLHGPDLSFESQNPELAHLDTFGHGTHLAAIIGGADGGPAGFRGIAPGARIVSVKVADAFGATDVSQVIAAVDWVVQHRHANGLNIRVLNLAFGTESGQDYRSDPLAHAVEVAWSKGIVVVVSAGNGGGAGLTDPAYDPWVLAVGAADTTGGAAAATVPDWSSRGTGTRTPDLVAPGVGIVSLRAPGSFIDEEYPGARVSGTSLPVELPAVDAPIPPVDGLPVEPPVDGPVVAPTQGSGAEPSVDPPAPSWGGEPIAPADVPLEADPLAGSPVDPASTDVLPPAEPEAPVAPDLPAANAAPETEAPTEPARFFRGSGTSQAAAIVSGVVALMLEQRRWLSPNKVKAALVATARPLGGPRAAEGAGLVDAAATFGQLALDQSWQVWARSTGMGALELARGGAHVVDPDGVELRGEQDIFGKPWAGAAWALASFEERSWSEGRWNGSPWAGTGFEGGFWAVAAWDAPAWSARSWAELAWSGRRWSGEEWTGESWWSYGWSGRRWTAASWMASWPSASG